MADPCCARICKKMNTSLLAAAGVGDAAKAKAERVDSCQSASLAALLTLGHSLLLQGF